MMTTMITIMVHSILIINKHILDFLGGAYFFMEEKKSNSTKYGESIPTLFSWISPEEQKKRAEEIARITSSGEKKK